ncbi:MAG: hypothetical protein ACFHVJ_06190 [Aestuariibacter sp.]
MMKQMKRTIIATMLLTSSNIYAVVDSNVSSNNGLSQEFFQRQVNQNMSVGRAVKSIVSHYPEHVESVVATALDLYPDRYKEIVHAAISAEPSLTKSIVRVAIEKGITSCPNIVETAINAEPSYVDFVVKAAANTTPGELQDIVRVAVVTEPDSADRIVQTLAQSHPNKLIEIVGTAIGAVPFVGEYIVDAMLAVFHEEKEQGDVLTTAFRQSSDESEYIKKIIASAKNAGMGDEAITQYAVNAGAKPEDVVRLLKETEN